MSIIEKIMNGLGYEKIERAPLRNSFGDATRNFFTTLSDTWEEKVAGPARERRAERDTYRRNYPSSSRSSSSTYSSYDSGPSFFGSGGGDSCGGGDGGGGGGE